MPFAPKHHGRAVRSHKARQHQHEIDLQVGDQIEVHVHTRGGEHLTGYSLGVNMRTEQRGYYPTFKVQHFVDEVKTPTYPDADIYTGLVATRTFITT